MVQAQRKAEVKSPAQHYFYKPIILADYHDASIEYRTCILKTAEINIQIFPRWKRKRTTRRQLSFRNKTAKNGSKGNLNDNFDGIYIDNKHTHTHHKLYIPLNEYDTTHDIHPEQSWNISFKVDKYRHSARLFGELMAELFGPPGWLVVRWAVRASAVWSGFMVCDDAVGYGDDVTVVTQV